MSQPCAIADCAEIAFDVCNCCQRSICKYHMTEHYNLLSDQQSQLINDINTLDETLKSFDQQNITGESREKLEQWRIECHQKIEDLFQKKSQEIDQYLAKKLEKQVQGVDELRARVTQLIGESGKTRPKGEINSLSLVLAQLKEDMLMIDQTYIQVRTRPLYLDETIVQVNETIRPVVDLSHLGKPWKAMEHINRSYCVLTSNDKYVLMFQSPNLSLMNDKITIVQQILWPFGKIRDLCYSSTLDRFVLISDHDVFLVNENIMMVERIPTRLAAAWFSCACSDSSLFLSTNEQISSIFVFDLSPVIKLDRQWKYPVVGDKREFIDTIVYNNGTIALLVRSAVEKTLRLELRFSSTFDCLWSLPLNITWNRKVPFRCCSLNFDEWLVADYQSGSLLHIAKSGHLKNTIKYPIQPYHVHLYKDRLLIIITRNGKSVHQLT